MKWKSAKYLYMHPSFSGMVVGLLSGIIGYKTLCAKPHIEYEELPDKKRRGKEILKYGIPERPGDLMFYKNHVLSYNAASRIPFWVAEHLTKDSLSGKANRKFSDFKPDPSIENLFMSENSDYWNSGWSRGHMAPAGDNKHDQEAMDESFLLTNIVPQDLSNNAGFWNRLEMYCRKLVKNYDDVRIFSGPVMVPETDQDGNIYVKYRVIGKNHVAVPTHLFKVIVADSADSNQFVAAFLVPNKPITFERKLRDYQVDVSRIESLIGFRLLPNLKAKSMKNLCNNEGCNLISKEEFEKIFLTSRIKNSRNIKDLEMQWKSATEQLDGKPSKHLKEAYNEAKQTLQARN
ncbi:DgyrCDS11628 [Dimorphilus gyrociliatus]|uniref:DgyrCDS11628 n=1 Tax=Dimorphilus gyrociliatus TaxID=2664684 RepID=A0A7I8W593_9ANNE|nr:DgyrCDS11628 [Dimorphilus gyrociliatus]